MGNDVQNIAEFINELVSGQLEQSKKIADKFDSESVLPFIDATCKGELAISAFQSFIDALCEFRSWYISNPEAAHNIRSRLYQMLLDAGSEISSTIITVARDYPTTRSA